MSNLSPNMIERIYIRNSISKKGEVFVKKLAQKCTFWKDIVATPKLIERELAKKTYSNYLHCNTFESRNKNLKNYATLRVSRLSNREERHTNPKIRIENNEDKTMNTRRIFSQSPHEFKARKIIIPTTINFQNMTDHEGYTFAKFRLKFKPPTELLNMKSQKQNIIESSNLAMRNVEQLISKYRLKSI